MLVKKNAEETQNFESRTACETCIPIKENLKTFCKYNRINVTLIQVLEN